MKNNDFINGGVTAITLMVGLSIIYNIGKSKGYNEGLKYQKDRMDIYNQGYADGCKQCNKD